MNKVPFLPNLCKQRQTITTCGCGHVERIREVRPNHRQGANKEKRALFKTKTEKKTKTTKMKETKPNQVCK